MDALKMKLIIIGDHCIGKTSIALRKRDNIYDTIYNPTIGVDFFYYRTNVNNIPVKISVWDTAGHDNYRNIIKLYFKESQGAVLVYDITNRNSFLNLKNWIIQLNENEFNGKVILVGNKCDSVNERRVTTEEGEQLALENDCLFIESSSKNNINIDSIFEKIVEKVTLTMALKDPKWNKDTSHRKKRFGCLIQ